MIGGSVAVGFFGEHSLSRLGVTGSTGFGDIVVPSGPDERYAQSAPPLRAQAAWQTVLYVFWSSSFRFGSGRSQRGFDL